MLYNLNILSECRRELEVICIQAGAVFFADYAGFSAASKTRRKETKLHCVHMSNSQGGKDSDDESFIIGAQTRSMVKRLPTTSHKYPPLSEDEVSTVEGYR